MRALEIGLAVFANRFNVPSDHTNWQNIIEEMEKALRSMGSDANKTADWKDQQEFSHRQPVTSESSKTHGATTRPTRAGYTRKSRPLSSSITWPRSCRS